DSLAGLAASAAIAVSDIPFNGPISEVRVGRLNGKFVVNPQVKDLPDLDLDIMVGATEENILMVEGEMREMQEADLIEALKVAHQAIKTQCRIQKELAAEVGKSYPKRAYSHEVNDSVLFDRMRNEVYEKIYEIARKGTLKHERGDAFDSIKDAFIMSLPETERTEKAALLDRYFHNIHREAVRDCVLNERTRLDGRKLDEIRHIWCEVDYLPAVHGSAIFTRGETQSLTTVTLGTKLDEQTIDGAVFEEKANFLLHYNFPPYSTGEVKRMAGTSRREVGHGNLALRALKPVLPGTDENPYTIRVVSDILESNGSSSMATVCAGTLALLDAGVKLKRPVSGIAMGLISDPKTGKYAVLSDILGDEDHIGDMDFKVTGTRKGITACQMDIKVDGLSYEILSEALDQARRGRLHILDVMEITKSQPREDYKPFVPRIEKITIPREFIGAVIGPGGKVIQEMQRETNTTIVLEEVGEYGIIDIVSSDLSSIQKVKDKIRRIVAVPELGLIYDGVVKTITNFGAFVEIMPGKDGLLHVSEIDWKRIENVESVLKVGDKIEVKLIDIDSKTGKLKLSRKVLLPKPQRGE
ncbi:MAG TPA: polyribonucleotide nucleotidyltransferase, partial [Bacteroidales bacterium]|nr:polyribonucleotide nucleotidyltransferase [Bacteroidales bacterium]